MAPCRHRTRTSPSGTRDALLRRFPWKFSDHLPALGRRQYRSRFLRICFLLQAIPARRRQPRTLPQSASRRAHRSDSNGNESGKTKNSLQRSPKNTGGRSSLSAIVVQRRRLRPPPFGRRPRSFFHRGLQLPPHSSSGKQQQLTASLQCFLNLRDRNRPFPANPPAISIQFDNRRCQCLPALSPIQNQWHPCPQLFHYMRRARARSKPGNIRARSRHRAVKLFDQLFHDRALRPAQRHSSSVRRHLQRHAAGRLHDQGQSPRPKSVRQPEETSRHGFHRAAFKNAFPRKQNRLINGIHENGQRTRLRTPLHAVDFIYSGQIEGIRSQSVHRVRGNRDHGPARKKIRGIAQVFRFGSLRIHTQQFSRQFLGLWRSRGATSQRSAPAALIWAKLPYHRNPCNKSLLPPPLWFVTGAPVPREKPKASNSL